MNKRFVFKILLIWVIIDLLLIGWLVYFHSAYRYTLKRLNSLPLNNVYAQVQDVRVESDQIHIDYTITSRETSLYYIDFSSSAPPFDILTKDNKAHVILGPHNLDLVPANKELLAFVPHNWDYQPLLPNSTTNLEITLPLPLERSIVQSSFEEKTLEDLSSIVLYIGVLETANPEPLPTSYLEHSSNVEFTYTPLTINLYN